MRGKRGFRERVGSGRGEACELAGCVLESRQILVGIFPEGEKPLIGRPALVHPALFVKCARQPQPRKRIKRRNRVETYAKRFAAKEACAKALGTGLRAGVWWRDMGVVNLPSGRPTLALTGGAKRRLAAMTPAGYEARIDLTMTDEGPMAQAFVVISATAIRDA